MQNDLQVATAAATEAAATLAPVAMEAAGMPGSPEEAAALGAMVTQLAPVVAKSGFKTSEFWLLALAMGGQMALVLGDHLPGPMAAALSMAGSGIYLFVRTAHKADAPERMQVLMGGNKGQALI